MAQATIDMDTTTMTLADGGVIALPTIRLEAPQDGPNIELQTSRFSPNPTPVVSHGSTIFHGLETFDVFVKRVEKLCQSLWPPPGSMKVRLLNSRAAARMRRMKLLRSLIPKARLPIIERRRGGDENRITAITLPSSHPEERRKLILRVSRAYSSIPANSLAIHEYVDRRTTLPVPSIVKVDCSNANPLGAPYIIQKRICGSDLSWRWPFLGHHERCEVAKEMGQVIHTLSSITASRIGVLVTGSRNTHPANIVPFQIKGVSNEPLGMESFASNLDFEAYHSKQTTFDFLVEHIECLKMYYSDKNHKYGADVWDSMLNLVHEMHDSGMFKEAVFSLCHRNLCARHIMAGTAPDGIMKITALLNWDKAIFAPNFVNYEPPEWIWNDQGGRSKQYDLYEPAGAGDLPDLQVNRKLKRIFEEHAGAEYLGQAYSVQARISRGIFRAVTQGLNTMSRCEEVGQMLEDWEKCKSSSRAERWVRDG